MMKNLNRVLFTCITVLLQTGLVHGNHEGTTDKCAVLQISACMCTSDNSSNVVKVECTDVGFTDDSFLHGGIIPSTIQTLIVRSNNISRLRDYLLTNCQKTSNNSPPYSELITLDLSSNGIGEIDENAFNCMPNLEKLILDENDYDMETHTSLFKPLDKLKVLSMKKAFYVQNETDGLPLDFLNKLFYDGKFRHDLLQLEELYLSDNHLHEVITGALCEMKELKLLHLSNNNITDIDAVVDCFEGKGEKLVEIYLDHNQISSPRFLDEKSAVSKWAKVNVAHNPFTCDCNILPFRKWLTEMMNRNESVVLELDEIKCHLPVALQNKNIFEVEIPACPRSHSFSGTSNLAYVLPIVAVTIIIAGVILYTVGFDKCKRNPKIRRKMVEAGVFKNPTYASF